MFNESEYMHVCKHDLEKSLERGMLGHEILTEEDLINSMIDGRL